MDILIPQIQDSLNLGSDWIIDQVLFDIEQQSVLLYISHSGKLLTCPETGQKTGPHDHTLERIWQHVDLWEYKCFIHCQIPRIKSPTGIRAVKVPWGDESSQFTHSFEHTKPEATAATDDHLSNAASG